MFKLKYSVFLFFLLYLLGCENLPDEVIEEKSVDYKVESITAPAMVRYFQDSLFITSLKIENNKTVQTCWFNINYFDGTAIYSNISLEDNGKKINNGDEITGDKIYSGQTIMKRKLPSGEYEIEYFIRNNVNPNPNSIKKVGVTKFIFDNGSKNTAPLISELVLADTVNRGESFTFTIKASDENGMIDIAIVYFELYRPDTTKVIKDITTGDTKFPMFDNGDGVVGDIIKDDGIYTLTNSFGSSSKTGEWKFEFFAKDRAGLLSNKITHKLVVK